MNLKTRINNVGQDLKISIDDLTDIILNIQEEIETVKVKTVKPDKATAKALLEYIALEDGKIKENIKILCSKGIIKYFKWLDEYCEENACSQEQALNLIIEGEI